MHNSLLSPQLYMTAVIGMQILAPCGEPILHEAGGDCFPCGNTQIKGALAASCVRNMHGALTGLAQLADEVPLKTLALHNICMPLQHTPLLHNVLSSLSDTLEELVLDLTTWDLVIDLSTWDGIVHDAAHDWQFSGQAKQRFFEAVAQLKRLKRFTLPQWVELVSCDIDCPEPLTRLDMLECVHVRKLPETVASGWCWKFVLLENSG